MEVEQPEKKFDFKKWFLIFIAFYIALNFLLGFNLDLALILGGLATIAIYYFTEKKRENKWQ